MRKTLLIFCALVICPLAVLAQSQSPSADSSEQYNAMLRAIQANAPSWLETVKGVKLEEVNTSYKMGKVIEDNKQTVITGINLIKSWAGSEQEKPSLYVEVNLMDVVKDLRANLASLSDNLISLQPNDLQSQKTLNGWGLTIERLAAGDVSKIEMEIVTHTMDRAQEADTLCATAHRK
jgi:hypothetical protein